MKLPTLVLAACFGLAPLALGWPRAASAVEGPDAGLLEFLGSVDSDDKDWHEYLARSPGGPGSDGGAAQSGRASGSGANPPPARPPTPPPPKPASVPPEVSGA